MKFIRFLYQLLIREPLLRLLLAVLILVFTIKYIEGVYDFDTLGISVCSFINDAYASLGALMQR